MKKFTALFICLLMVITCGLAGCAGFSINKVKYYNEVLAEVGDTHITRYDLLSAYNSYGQSYYVSQMGKSEEEALASTLDLLIEREALYQYASNSENNNTYKPTPYQINSIVEDMFESLDNQLATYTKTAKSILNIDSEETEESKEDEETAYLFEDYVVTNESRRAFVETTVTYYTDSTKSTVSQTETAYYTTEDKIIYNANLMEEPETYDKVLEDKFLNNHTADGIITAIQNKYFSTSAENKGLFIKHLEETEAGNETRIYNKVLELFTADLLDYEHYLRDENGKEYSKNTNDLVYRYIERNFDSEIQSQYLENVRTEYLKKEETSLSINLLLNEFNELYTKSYNKYNNRESSYKDAMKNAGTDADSILYHPNLTEDDTQFGYFIHTLISFNETQKSLYKTMESMVREEEKADFLNLINNLFYSNAENGNLIHPRDAETGLVDTSVSYTLEQVIEEYNAITAIADYNEKMSSFINFMFKYTGDTATLNSGMPYVVGTNGYSAMEQSFTDECVKLMETGNKGEMSSVSASNLGGMCVTSYGIHLVMYVGEVNAYDYPLTDTNYAYISDVNKSDDSNGVFNLYHKTLNPLTNETYFDMLFNSVYPSSGDAEVFTSENGYSAYEESLIEEVKNNVKIYKTKLEGTKTSL